MNARIHRILASLSILGALLASAGASKSMW